MPTLSNKPKHVFAFEKRMGERYLNGEKTRASFPRPEEFRRLYGENAPAAAGVGTSRPLAYIVLLLMILFEIIILVVARGHGAGFPGWAVLMMSLDFVFGCVLITAGIFRNARVLASLRVPRAVADDNQT
jgi:hypothetical protein